MKTLKMKLPFWLDLGVDALIPHLRLVLFAFYPLVQSNFRPRLPHASRSRFHTLARQIQNVKPDWISGRVLGRLSTLDSD